MTNLPSVTEAEFQAILSDTTKRVAGDLSWRRPEDGHATALAFRADIENAPQQPLLVKVWYNRVVPTLSFSLIHRPTGRIYGLDIGPEHHNPSCTHIGSDTHKHVWTDAVRDKHAYRPEDITARADQPNLAWEQFCREANITHDGVLYALPPAQSTLFQ
jgi:hypothetical protein